MEYLGQIIVGIIIAAVSSFLTVQLSLKRYRTEKWWEKRAETYTNILGLLHDAKEFSEENMEADLAGRELTEQEDKDLRARSTVCTNEIYRAMDMGQFYFSPEAIARLKKYKKESSEAGMNGDWNTYLVEDFDAAESCLKDIIKIAKSDLRVEDA